MKFIPLYLCLLLLTSCAPSTSLGKRPQNPGEARQKDKQAEAIQRKSTSESQELKPREIKLFPVDEGPSEPSFKEFRERLIDAVTRRDSKFIISILDPNILNSLGGNGGIEEFIEYWKLDRADSRFWREFKTVISMGGKFSKENGAEYFCAPYVVGQWEEVQKLIPDSSDAYQYAAVLGKDVGVKGTPNSASPEVITLSYDIVKVNYKERTNDSKWVKITTLDGKEGFVLGENIRSPSDYHACFKKDGDKWLMTIFSAGD